MEHLPSDANSLAGSAKPGPDGPQGKRQQESSESRDASFPRTISGLDTALGLRRAMGLEDFYLSMLRGFIESRRDTAKQIRAALGTHDMKKAEFLSHSLLGISAQIGAIRVPADAQALEIAISAGRSEELVRELLLRLEASLAELIESLESALPPIFKPL